MRTKQRAHKSAAEIEEQIAALKKRKQQLEKQIMLVQNRKEKIRRKEETRKKILMGAERLNRLKKGEMTNQQLLEELDSYLTRPGDRALFGLPTAPISKEAITPWGQTENRAT